MEITWTFIQAFGRTQYDGEPPREQGPRALLASLHGALPPHSGERLELEGLSFSSPPENLWIVLLFFSSFIIFQPIRFKGWSIIKQLINRNRTRAPSGGSWKSCAVFLGTICNGPSWPHLPESPHLSGLSPPSATLPSPRLPFQHPCLLFSATGGSEDSNLTEFKDTLREFHQSQADGTRKGRQHLYNINLH